ncbi:hypothetical protein ACJX0J_022667, partial [Zea mays]
VCLFELHIIHGNVAYLLIVCSFIVLIFLLYISDRMGIFLSRANLVRNIIHKHVLKVLVATDNFGAILTLCKEMVVIWAKENFQTTRGELLLLVIFGENMFSVRNQLVFATWVLLMFTNGLDKKHLCSAGFFLCFIAMGINYLLVPHNYDTDTFFKSYHGRTNGVY